MHPPSTTTTTRPPPSTTKPPTAPHIVTHPSPSPLLSTMAIVVNCIIIIIIVDSGRRSRAVAMVAGEIGEGGYGGRGGLRRRRWARLRAMVAGWVGSTTAGLGRRLGRCIWWWWRLWRQGKTRCWRWFYSSAPRWWLDVAGLLSGSVGGGQAVGWCLGRRQAGEGSGNCNIATDGRRKKMRLGFK
ncbi:hypothetical protein Dimus_037898 [Dionaea muscipula]